MPALVPLLAPLTPRQEVLHQIRNRLTYIAGTAHLLRRRSKLGTLDPETDQVRLEHLENAVWQVNALLDEAESD